jgi:hypothetical protein
LTWVVAIVGHVLMQDGPKPLNRIEMRAVRRQLDQMDTASCPGEEGSDIGTFVVGSVVPDDMNDAFVRVARFDLGQKLCCTDPINGCGLDEGCNEAFEVHSPMNVHTTAPCRAENRWVDPTFTQPDAGLVWYSGCTASVARQLIARQSMRGGEVDGFICW